jgi:hypothetical protein
MSRALVVLDTEFQRRRAADWCWSLKPGTRVEFKAPRRTDEQNAKMWAMLTEVATQVRWHGLKLAPDDWKLILMAGLKRELRLVPNIDGDGFVNLSTSSSDLSKEEMSDLIELMFKFGANPDHPVQFREPSEASPQAEDEGSGEDSPSPPAADPSAQAEEPEAERPETGQGGGAVEPAPGVSQASEADKRECLSKFLALAAEDLPLEDRLKNIEFAKDCWKRDMPTEADFVKACMTTADKVAKGELAAAAARKYLEGLLS